MPLLCRETLRENRLLFTETFNGGEEDHIRAKLKDIAEMKFAFLVMDDYDSIKAMFEEGDETI